MITKGAYAHNLPEQIGPRKRPWPSFARLKSLFQSANEANLGITSRQCESISRTKAAKSGLKW